MEKPLKIVENVYLVGSEELSGAGDCMIYAIGYGNKKLCLIDAGTNNANKIIANIEQTPLKGSEITHLILTHCHYDHIGAAHQFKALYPNMEIIAHDWDAAAIEGKPNTSTLTAADWYGQKLNSVKITKIINKDLEILVLGEKKLQILHTPGHTPGSISILYQTPKKIKVLFGQDIHGPFMKEFNSNKQDWRNSMKKLLSFEPDILCEGHFGIFWDKHEVSQFITSHLRQN